MSSVILSRRVHNLHSIRDHRNNQPYNTDDEEINESRYQYSSQRCSTAKKPIRALSCDQAEVQSIKTTNNRFRHLCSRLKHRLTLTKENRTHSEDPNTSTSERRLMHSGNSKSFSPTVDEPSNDIEWPDFEKVYESIPSCLINALPGLDDFSIEEKYDYSLNISNFQTDQTEQCSNERMNSFGECKRGKDFRRNAICQKLDKIEYSGQLDIFVQQLMVEKLMRTWT